MKAENHLMWLGLVCVILSLTTQVLALDQPSLVEVLKKSLTTTQEEGAEQLEHRGKRDTQEGASALEMVVRKILLGSHIPGNQKPGNPIAVGSTYIRWGRKTCPVNATLMYEGFAGGSWYDSYGGGSDYQCLPLVPQFGKVTAGAQSGSYMYGSEYELQANSPFPGGKALQEMNVPCAMCYVPRSVSVMIPAWQKCPDTWRKEYSGYLMTSSMSQKKSTTFTCMDEEAEPSGYQAANVEVANTNGALFYIVEAYCGSLPCPPYVKGNELTCVICSK